MLLSSSDYPSVPAGYSNLPASLLSALVGSGVQNDRPGLYRSDGSHWRSGTMQRRKPLIRFRGWYVKEFFTSFLGFRSLGNHVSETLKGFQIVTNSETLSGFYGIRFFFRELDLHHLIEAQSDFSRITSNQRVLKNYKDKLLGENLPSCHHKVHWSKFS